MSLEQLAEDLRKLVSETNELTLKLEHTLRKAREAGLEVELMDGTNAEIAHDLDGLTAFKLKITKIMARMPL